LNDCPTEGGEKKKRKEGDVVLFAPVRMAIPAGEEGRREGKSPDQVLGDPIRQAWEKKKKKIKTTKYETAMDTVFAYSQGRGRREERSANGRERRPEREEKKKKGEKKKKRSRK